MDSKQMSSQHSEDSKKGGKLPSADCCLLFTNRGFSIVELLITMAVFMIVIVAGTQIFTGLLTQFKQQGKIGESDIEGAVGLSIMRFDLAHAGYGLPWNVQDSSGTSVAWSSLVNYCEAKTGQTAIAGGWDPSGLNDGFAPTDSSCSCNPSGAPCGGNAPRPIVSQSNSIGQSYLVIRSAVAATNYAAGKWTNLRSGNTKTRWTPDTVTPANQNVNVTSSGSTNDNVQVIVLALGSTPANEQSLVLSGSSWFTTYASTSGFAPTDANETRLIYGLDPNTDSPSHPLRMPFNRTDYFINRPDTIPARCAPNTGILYKATVNQKDGGLTVLPLLDCVAYMHVDYMMLYSNGNYGALDDISGLAADQIRGELMEARVYIIAQEGQRDVNYDFSNGGTRTNFKIPFEALGSWQRGPIYLPYTGSDPTQQGSLATIVGAEYKYYRWKLYTLVVRPNSLR